MEILVRDVDDQLKDRLEELARDRGESRNAVVLQLLRRAVDRERATPLTIDDARRIGERLAPLADDEVRSDLWR